MRRANAERIRFLRGEETQEALAFRTGLSLSTIRNIETGRIKSPNTLTLRALAEALSTTVDDITAGSEDEPAEASA
jgi:transcriptional regulator with XRE-family HTH domain